MSKKLFVSIQQLSEKLKAVKGATFAGVVTETEPKVNKSCPLAIKKLTISNVILGAFYERSVNRQLEREEKESDFVAQPRKWGNHILGTPLVEHVKDGERKEYLACQFRSAEASYLVNGETVEKESIAEYLPKESDPREVQGTEKAVVYRTYSLESIREITLNGETLIVAKG